jgi:two-component system NtrC family sensor kinase
MPKPLFMKKIPVLVILSLLAVFASAQQKKTDSLIKILKSAPGNDSRLTVLKQLADERADASTTIKYATEGLALAKKLDKPKEEEYFLLMLGRSYFSRYNSAKLLEVYSEGLALSSKLKDDDYTYKFLYGISLSYTLEKEMRKAINYELTAASIAGKIKQKRLVGPIYYAVSWNYINLKLIDSAYYYMKKSYRVDSASHDPDIGSPLFGLGVIENIYNHPAVSLSYLHRSIPFSKKQNAYLIVAAAYHTIAEVYKKQSRSDSALYYARLGFQIALQHHELVGIYRAAELMSDLLAGKNDKESLRYYKISVATKESISNTEKSKQFQIEAAKEQQQVAAQKNADIAYQNKLKLYGILLVLVLVLVIAGILWRNNKKQQLANQLLQKQQDELKATQTQLIQSEKMASLGELTAGIAHEIQNPLNFVNNFSEVNREMLEELKAESRKQKAERDEQLETELINDLIENEQKINHHGKRADSIVKGMLQHSKASSGTKEPTNINALADEYMRLSYHGLRAKDKSFNAELTTHFDKNLPQVNVMAQDIGRVLLNLFNNAFYAVHEKQKIADAGYKPEVTVTTLSENGRVVIKVRDNGTGIPDAIKDKIMQPFFTTKPTGEGTGLGLSLSYDIVVKGHGGSIAVDSKDGAGSEFIIILPIN